MKRAGWGGGIERLTSGVRVFGRGRASVAAGLALAAALSMAPSEAGAVLYEKSVNLDIAKRVRARLLAVGADVLMTRTSDRYVALSRRTGLANARGTDVFVSIHNNAGSRTAERTEVYRQISSTRSRRLGGDIAQAFRKRFPGRDTRLLTRRGKNGDYYYQLRTTRMPAVIVEGAFLSNPKEARLLATAAFRRRIADAIADGILAYAKAPPPGPPPRLDPGTRVASEQLPPPARAAIRRVGRQVRLGWVSDPAVPAYRVYRGHQLVAELPNPAFGQPGGAARMEWVDRWTVPRALYRYSVFATIPAPDPAGVALESPPVRLRIRMPAVPIFVALDPGHGGRDPGAIGRY